MAVPRNRILQSPAQASTRYKDSCFSVPDGWYIGKKLIYDSQKEIVLGKNTGNSYELVSFLLGMDQRFMKAENNPMVAEISPDHKVYELINLDEDIHVRYWARGIDEGFVLGGSISNVRESVKGTKQVDCK